ncbi:MAG: TonB-dependent receptor [Bryobacterales bacterium]|nr:TonB-dependent receptor [Bryobacterales bacterium]
MLKALASIFLVVCLAPNLGAQATAGFGALSGVVRDGTGAVIPSAEVIVANSSKGIERKILTNDSGVFNAPALVPAEGYSVRATAQGFQTYEARNIPILVGQNVSLNITLQIATATTQVEVLDVAPVVEQTKTGNSQVVNSKQILNLPINGRRVDSFVLLAPAVVSDGTFGLVSFRGIAGGNTFLTDGNDTTNSYYNENAGRTRISTQISQDAVQEFEVLSNGYSAEYGRASGGIINTVTRSGTNDVHGTGYWFFRNQEFNARDRYATVNPPETRHQFGGSLGGRIVKDKLFYFFNSEIIRRDFPLDASITRPPLFNAAGQFVGTCDATPAQCQAATRFITERHFRSVPRRANSELGFGKIDWRPTDRNAISLSFNYLRWISPGGIQSAAALNTGAGVGNNGDSTVRTRYGRVSWTAIPSNTVVNEVRYGWFKDRLFDDQNAELRPVTGLIAISVQGQTNLGVPNYLPRLNPSENRHQIADTLTWTAGKHTLKFGGDIMNTNDYSDQLFNGRGSYTYPTFTAFALDFSGNTTGAKRWQSYSQAFGNPVVSTTVRDYSVFAQDQFRATKNLTLNFGLRYEYSQFSQPSLVNPGYPQTGVIRQPGKNFAPRIGLAWAFNDNKTVIRTGYGLFYARFPGGLINTLHLNNGLYQRNISLNAAIATDLAAGPVFPLPLPNLDRTPPAGTIDLAYAAPDFRNPYTQQADFGIERELTQQLGLTVSYVWSRGARLFTVRDLNVGALGEPVTYRILDDSRNQVGTYSTPTYRLANRVDRNWRRINQVENGGNSYYNAMIVQVRKRMSRSWEGHVSYTWSHAIDNNQGGGSDNIFFSGGPRSLFNGDYQQDKASSSLDQRHRFVTSTIWAPQFVKRDSGAAKWLVNNWQLSQITTLASAQPQTPTIFVSGNPFAGAAFNTSLNGFGGSSRVPFLPASSLDIDQIYRTDARLTKILPFAERYQVHFNFEVFNLFNHVSNTSVNGQAFQAAAGALTPTAGLGDGSASGGFPDGTNARRAQISLRFIF